MRRSGVNRLFYIEENGSLAAEKWVVWGAGKRSQYFYNYIKESGEGDKVSMVVDADAGKWGTIWHGHIIQSPEQARTMEFDKIIITMADWRSIYDMLIGEWGIASQKIDNLFFHQRAELIQSYEGIQETDPEKRKLIDYIKRYPLDVFNDGFAAKYSENNFKVAWDEKNSLFYVIHAGKRMYFSRRYISEKMAADYYRSLLLEQDAASPHRYLSDAFRVKEGDIVLDAGAAEGNFALEIVDFVKKLYLVEADEEWIEALRLTFAPYKDRVCIVPGFLSDQNGRGFITLDELTRGREINVVKMDIEGSEAAALRGGRNTFLRNDIRAAICSYHRKEDYDEIAAILKDYGYHTSHTGGYMVFITSQNFNKIQMPEPVRGIIYAGR